METVGVPSLLLDWLGAICDSPAHCVIHFWSLRPSGEHTSSMMMKHVSRSGWRVLDVLQRLSNHRGPAEAPGGVLITKNISALLRSVSGHLVSDKCLFSSLLTCWMDLLHSGLHKEKYANNLVCDFSLTKEDYGWCHGTVSALNANACAVWDWRISVRMCCGLYHTTFVLNGFLRISQTNAWCKCVTVSKDVFNLCCGSRYCREFRVCKNALL